MTHEEFEQAVASHYQKLGYEVTATPKSYDYGVDVIAKNKTESIAIQAKMYDQARRVNYQSVMYLFAAMHLFGCKKAVIITSGIVRDDAKSVAFKLGVDIHEHWNPTSWKGDQLEHLPTIATNSDNKYENPATSFDAFGRAWQKFIMPLKGKRLYTFTGKVNTILDVDWNYVRRISSNGESSKIAIEIFRQSFHYALEHGKLTRDEINQNYTKRGSAIIFAVLSEIPFFDVLDSGKATLRINNEKFQQFKLDETHDV